MPDPTNDGAHCEKCKLFFEWDNLHVYGNSMRIICADCDELPGDDWIEVNAALDLGDDDTDFWDCDE